MAQTGKPVTLVLVEGRPRLISPFEPAMDAVVMGYLPGNRGGDAIANVLFGDVNPSGKLPFSYPQYPNARETYDHRNTQQIGQSEQTAYNPQYPFGHGLSYTRFEYSNLQLSDTTLTPEGKIQVEIKVSNTGERKGKETVIMFVRDHYASVTPSVKRLKAFEKIELEPGQSQKVAFEIQPEDLMFVGPNNEWILEPGEFSVMISTEEASFILHKS